jgi:amino acid transporter
MAQSRVAYALSRDGYFPKTFFNLHKRFSTPYVAILVGSIFVAATAATGLVNFVTYATDFGFIIGFVLVNLSLIKLRQKRPEMVRPFKVPLYPLTPILGIATSLLLIFFLEPATLVIGAELFLFGLLVYYVKMVGYCRLCIAMGGMNLGVSAFSALVAYLLMSKSLPITLSSNVMTILFICACLVSVTYFGAAIMNMTTENTGDPHHGRGK